MRINHALIMAAGRGARMMPLTHKIPKPMAPFDGSTLIARGIGKIRDRLPNIHVTVGYKSVMLARHVIEHGASSIFNTSGHGNSWWVYHTPLKSLDEPIYVLTCDNVVELDFDLIEENYQALDAPACMLIPVKPVDGLEGDYIFHENHLVTEVNRYKPSEIYCSGIQVLNPAKINRLTAEGSDFYSIWQQLIEQQQLQCSSVYPKKWFSVDTVAQLDALNLSASAYRLT